jgi:hypothetical protein
MASGIGDFARKVANRAETVVGDDARALKEGVRSSMADDRAMYRYYTGSQKRSNGKRKSTPQRRSSSR